MPVHTTEGFESWRLARDSRALPKLTREQATMDRHAGKANKLKL